MSALLKTPEKPTAQKRFLSLPMAPATAAATDLAAPLPALVLPCRLSEYDWIVVSSSGGKDSQAMLDCVCRLAEAEGVLHRVVVVHCDLGRVEWPHTAEIAEAQAARYGVRFIKVWRRQGDLLQHIEQMGFFPKPTTRYCTSDHKRDQIFRVFTQLANLTNEVGKEATLGKRDGDLLDQVEARGMWPDMKRRYCTSDHKRAQVHRLYTLLSKMNAEAVSLPDAAGALRADYLKTHEGFPEVITDVEAAFPKPKAKTNPKPVRILSCQGMRAQESPARAKRAPFERDKRASNGRRLVDNWLTIHHLSEASVWALIASSRTADLVHYAYGLGMPRVSCVFCIFAPFAALVIAGRHNYELLCEYVRIEAKIGHRFRADFSLAQVKAAIDSGAVVGKVSSWTM